MKLVKVLWRYRQGVNDETIFSNINRGCSPFVVHVASSILRYYASQTGHHMNSHLFQIVKKLRWTAAFTISEIGLNNLFLKVSDSLFLFSNRRTCWGDLSVSNNISKSWHAEEVFSILDLVCERCTLLFITQWGHRKCTSLDDNLKPFDGILCNSVKCKNKKRESASGLICFSAQ